jgi:dTDP-4-dehydrorhamnose reductase
LKILLLGKNGQVGKELQRSLSALGKLVALDRNDANLEDLPRLAETLRRHSPDIIVNAAAYTAVDKAEEDRAAAFKTNAEAVATLAGYAKETNALLIHYSTDYVFDGEKKGAYIESDAPNPLSVYGKSKLKGEQAILDSQCNALIFRTSWVFSVHGSNFVKTILRLASEKDRLSVIADQFGAPTSADLIADFTALAITDYRSGTIDNGIYHLTATGETSWHGLAKQVVQQAIAKGACLMLKPKNIEAIPTEAYPLPAKRPKNSRLDSSLLADELDLTLPNWKIDVNRVVEQLVKGEVHS